jgi:uncharacterized protein (TIGR03437 family)
MRRKKLFCPLFYFCVMTQLLNAEVPASVVGAGYRIPTPVTVAPGQVITFFVHGIGVGITQSMRAPGNPLPTSLGGISATFRQFNPDIPVPVFAVEPISSCADSTQTGCSGYTAITVQLPYEMQAEDPTHPRGAPVGSAQLFFSEHGAVASKIDLITVVDQVHLLRTCDVLFTRREITCRAVVAHSDGSLVTAERPAHGGEKVVLYAYGLGSTTTNPPTGLAALQHLPTSLSFTISFDPRQNALASRPQMADPVSAAAFAGLTPNYVGLYQLNVTVPDLPQNTLPCYPASWVRGSPILSNMTINVGGPSSFDGVGICVEPLASNSDQ